MSIARLLPHTCTIQTPTEAFNSLGEKSLTYPGTTQTGVKCRRQTSDVQELIDGRQLTIEKDTLFLDSGASITEKSRVVMDGLTFEVKKVHDRPGGTSQYVGCEIKQIGVS